MSAHRWEIAALITAAIFAAADASVILASGRAVEWPAVVQCGSVVLICGLSLWQENMLHGRRTTLDRHGKVLEDWQRSLEARQEILELQEQAWKGPLP